MVPVVRLIDALWPEDPPHSAVENVRTYVCELRSQLRLEGDRPRLETYSQAYRLEAEPDELDMLRFNALACAGEEALRHSDFPGGAALLGKALDLWRDAPLSGLEISVSMRAKTLALEERRRLILLKWLKARSALGEHEDLVPMLREMVAERPLDESLWCALATTLHSIGRTGEALAACTDARTALVDQLGIEPGPELNGVQLAILKGETPPRAFSRCGTEATVRPAVLSQIPCPTPDFVGRAPELESVADCIERSGTRGAFVALYGCPGAGKTATALVAAATSRARFPHGQLYVDLKGSSDDPLTATDALASLLSALGLGPDAIPTSFAPRRSLFRSMLADRRVLLVLDDVADPEQMAPLVPGGRHVVIATSRRWLVEIPADAHFVIGALSLADSLAMLRGMVGADRVDGDLDGAVAVCEACGRTPLALRIAGLRLAARPTHPLQFLAERLAHGRVLDELSMNGLSVRDRYETSYLRLEAACRRCFRVLASVGRPVVAASDVAAALSVPVLEADRLLEDLVHHGLLTVGPEHDGRMTYIVPRLLLGYARELGDGPAEGEYAGGAPLVAGRSMR